MNLASAEMILRIDPIEGADMIEKATILGWEVVIKKGEFKAGDLAAYIQIDTVVPDIDQFHFLDERHFRVRTIKLRKQISQGLIVPLPPGTWQEGDDLTEILGVKKYSKDPEVFEDRPRMPNKWYKKWWYILKFRFLVKIFPGLKKVNRARFPKDLCPITDEERIQNMPQILTSHAGKPFIVSEKLDGSSITIIKHKKRYRVCSRRFELLNAKNEWREVFESTGFAAHIEALATHFKTTRIIVQGEFIGKPQGNRYQLPANEIRLFNIYVDGARLNQSEFHRVCEAYKIPCVPLLHGFDLNFDLPGIIKFAEGKSILNKTIEREGLVFRCTSDQTSFKVISNKYLLLNNE